jgi:hypothetical protein
MKQIAPYIEHGRRNMMIEPEELVIRPRGLDTTAQIWLTDHEDSFANGGAPPGRPHMRIKEVQTKADGPRFIHRVQAEGLAKAADKIEARRIRQPEEGWDEGPIELLTLNPNQYAQGDLVPGYETLWIVGLEKDDINGHVWRLSLDTKGILAPKARKRRITVNNQPVSSSTTLALADTDTFKDEDGTFTGWADSRYTALDSSRVVVVDTLLTTEAPPTDKLPGHLTPENAPPVLDIFAIPWWSTAGFTWNWPWGWSLKGINSEQLLDKDLWVTTITTEYVPRAVVR